MQRESVFQSVLVAACLCIVCSVFVSSAAVLLKPRQEANKLRQMQLDVLSVAGLYHPGTPVFEQFQQVETRTVDLKTGQYVDLDTLPAEARDLKAALKDPDLSVAVGKENDLAGLRRRERYSAIFLVKDDSGQLQQVILPVRGKGLWSTMYGFLSLEPDFRTVHGITFYEHGETPGLGGEIESDKFKRQWKGKVVRDADGAVRFDFVRGSVDPTDPDASHKIDGIAGATITTRGVIQMIRFWLGPNGFQRFLDRQGSNIDATTNAVSRLH